MSTEFERPPFADAFVVDGGLAASLPAETVPPSTAEVRTLASLPLGARLVLRCRKDWRTAAVAAVNAEAVTLSVCSPSGHTYRLRRAPDAPLAFDGHIPLLGPEASTCWRAALARYDARW